MDSRRLLIPGDEYGMVRLLDDLIVEGLMQAARGLFHDAFRELSRLQVPMNVDFGRDLQRVSREDIMALIGDNDGQMLQTWLHLFLVRPLDFDASVANRIRDREDALFPGSERRHARAR